MRDERIVALRPQLGRRNTEWAAALAEVATAVADGDPSAILTAPVRVGMQASRAIGDAHAFVEALTRAVTDHERTLTEDGDPLEMLREIREALTVVAGLDADAGEVVAASGGGG